MCMLLALQHLTRPYQYEQLNKRSEQMYKLIAICISLCPQRNVEDIVMQHLQDKYSDQLARLAKVRFYLKRVRVDTVGWACAVGCWEWWGWWGCGGGPIGVRVFLCA